MTFCTILHATIIYKQKTEPGMFRDVQAMLIKGGPKGISTSNFCEVNIVHTEKNNYIVKHLNNQPI